MKKKQIFAIVWFTLCLGLILFTDSYVVCVTAIAALFGSFIVFGILELKDKKDWGLLVPIVLSIPFAIFGLFPLLDFIAGPEKEVVVITEDSIVGLKPEEHDVVPEYEHFLEFGGEVYFKDKAAKKVNLYEMMDTEITVTYYKLTNRIVNIENK